MYASKLCNNARLTFKSRQEFQHLLFHNTWDQCFTVQESLNESKGNLQLYRSIDGAKTWNEDANKEDRYASYSDMGMFRDGTIALYMSLVKIKITSL